MQEESAIPGLSHHPYGLDPLIQPLIFLCSGNRLVTENDLELAPVLPARYYGVGYQPYLTSVVS